MKSSIFKAIVTAGMALAAFGFAQDVQKSANNGAGIRAAFDYNMMYGFEEEDDNIDEDPSGIGFEIGVAGRFEMIPNLYATPELNFSYSSTSQKYNKMDRTYTSMGIEIPILIRGVIMDRFYVTAGPQINFSLSNEVEQKYKDLEFGSIPDDLKDDFDQGLFSFGIALGGGVNVVDNLFVDFRFYMGLSQLFPDVAVMGEDIMYLPAADKKSGTWITIEDHEEYTDGRSMMNMEGAKMMTFKIGISYWFM